eukprot:2086022-Heterocapsa_arctica.AAC.1
MDNDFWAWAATSKGGRDSVEGVGRVDGQEPLNGPEDPGPGGQGHARGVWKILIGQWRAVQQGALKVRSSNGVSTCRVMRRTTTAWPGSSATT